MSATVWQFGSNDPSNVEALETIQQWWARLSGKSVTWQQRVGNGGAPAELDWETQGFDEQFALVAPELKGITVFWSKAGDDARRDLTASRFELDRTQQALFITLKSKPDTIVRVGVPQPKYEKLTLDPSVVTVVDGTLVLRDRGQMLEIRAKLAPEQLAQLQSDLERA
ncbi:MAG: hypothetical protein ACFB9N_12780 [Geitlerinemataceae cyanobacterium]